jgi:hypothetical protein
MTASTIFISKKVRQGSKTMRNSYWFVLFAVYFVCLIFCATYTYASTIEASSCSLAHVQAAVNAAGRGDTVSVPAGSCKWTGTLSITKAIVLQGAGAGNTVITSNFTPSTTVDGVGSGESLIFFKSSNIAGDTNTQLRITGFTFDLNNKTSGILVNNFSITALNKLRIDNNTFLNCYFGGKTSFNWYSTIITNGTIYGVIHSNTFLSGVPHLCFMGWNSNTWNSRAYTYGGADNIILEDNDITLDTYNIFLTDNGSGASVVWRYNTLRVKFNEYAPIFSVHGNVGAQTVYASMGGEHYGNRIISDYSNTLQTFELRGGMSMTFYNKVTAGSNYSKVQEYEGSGRGADYGSLTNYFCPSGTLYAGTKSCAIDGQPQHVWKTYIWNNRLGAETAAGSILSVANLKSISPEKMLRENVDFWKDNSACIGSSCTAGVGCGTLDNLPETCTTGVAYWATDQSCSAVPTASVGKNPTRPISGTLYRCGPTNKWAPYYTPYTYPHPLRSGEAEDISAPKGFKLVN